MIYEEKDMKKKSTVTWICIGLALCLIGAMFQWLILTDFGKAKHKQLMIITESGYQLSMDAYIPKTATAENPAPTIVVMHGGNDDKDTMVKYPIELVRRGYVVVNVDMYNHGRSEDLPDSKWLTAGRGFYDAVRNVVTWPFVDTDRLSMLGYSRGGKSAGEALKLDNETLNVVKSIFLVYSDPIYTNADGYTDVYGPRDIAVVADCYDEFFFTEKKEDTSNYVNDTNKFMRTLTSPLDYLENNSAQSFLHFGEDPTGLDKREERTVYEKTYPDGRVGTREITMIKNVHTSGQYSTECLKVMLDFYERVLPAPVKVSGTINVPYDLATLIGVLGLFILLVNVIQLVIQRVGVFQDLQFSEPVITTVTNKKRFTWQWIAVIAEIIFTIFIIWLLNKLKISAYHDSFFRSAFPLYFSVINLSAVCFTITMFVITYKRFGSEGDFPERLVRIMIGWKKVAKSAVVALIGIVAFYMVVFFAYRTLGTIYKFIIWPYAPFDPQRIWDILTVIPPFTLYYVTSSISYNALGYSSILGKNKWTNALVTGLIAAIPMLCVLGYCYGSFAATGWNPMFGGSASTANSVFKTPMIVFINLILSRKIYEEIGNPYPGGIAAGILTAITVWTVCETRLPEVGEPFIINWKIVAFFAVVIAVVLVCLRYFYKEYLKLNPEKAGK